MPDTDVLTSIQDLAAVITPLDELEREHLEGTRAWLAATDDIFRRTSSPVAPAKHLVSYFLLVDPRADAVLLGEHRKSGLWLPAGGHVEPGEHPAETVRRECLEELGVDARFCQAMGERPLFLTVGQTRFSRPEQHTDVCFWFVLEHSRAELLKPDPREYYSVRWWTTAEIRAADPQQFDPHQSRMLDKLALYRL